MRPIQCTVTGGAGFLGYHLTKLLTKHGYKITVIDDLSSGYKENIPDVVDFLKLDVSDPNTMKIAPKADYIFHLAAIASIQESIKDPIRTHKANVQGVLNILDYCRRTGAKLIFSSSSSIYNQGSLAPYAEDASKRPLNPYSLQKLQSEQYIEMYARLYGVRYAILRYSNLFGERANTEGPYPAVTAIFLKRRKGGKVLQITGDGSQKRDFVYAGDVAMANLMAMDWHGTYNIGAGHAYSVSQIADFIGGDHEHVPAREGEMLDNTLDIAKAKKAGWGPRVDVKDWVSDAL